MPDLQREVAAAIAKGELSGGTTIPKRKAELIDLLNSLQPPDDPKVNETEVFMKVRT